MSSTLINKNVVISGHRTSMRLEPVLWDSLDEICALERKTIHEMCSMIDAHRRESSLTAAVRVFIVAYYRAMIEQQGAGHRVEKSDGRALRLSARQRRLARRARRIAASHKGKVA